MVFPPVTMARADTVRPMPEVTDWLGTSTLGTSTLGGADGAFYLVVSRLLPYKNVDAIVRAFADSERRLVVVGRGPQADRLRAMKTPNVTMVSDISDGELAWLYKNCRAIIAASYEDYGLTPSKRECGAAPPLRCGTADSSTPSTRASAVCTSTSRRPRTSGRPSTASR